MNTSQRLLSPPRSKAGFACSLLLGACLLSAYAQEQEQAVEAATEVPEVINNSNLNAENALLILLGELQVTQGDTGAAYAMLLEAARKTNDEGLYKRAVDIALNARNGAAALDGAKAWKKAFPLSRDANRYVLQIQVALNQLAESLMPLRSYIQLAPESEHVLLINGMPQIFAQAKDQELATAVVEQALVPFVDKPATAAASWTTIGRMRVAAKKLPEALDAVNKALSANPQAMEPGFLLLELLSLGVTEAEPILQRILSAESPPHMRLTYARVLMDGQRLPDAAEQLQKLNQSHPDFAEAWLVMGALQVELRNDEQAQQALLRYIELEQSKEDARLSQAYLMLSKIATNQKKTADAEAWLNKIDDPEALTQVQIQRANLLASRGDMAKARALIADLPHHTPQAKRIRIQAEAQLLRDYKMYEQAYQVLLKASKAEPDDLELRYEVAMLAEKLNRMDEMEKLLRSIIAEKPDFQHAYNALGYALADRHMRLPEARALIVKALEFSPEDPMITDSLGWVEFRMGNKQTALAILQRAYDTKNDPEIATHLGEVQWSLGLKEKALKTWRDALKSDPKNELLLDTLKRLKVKL
jgi:tetratricopeptide (TPR) repeat protein